MIFPSSVVTMIVTYICFFVEAMIHYNIGYRSSNPNDTTVIVFPNMADLIKIILTVGLFSFICGVTCDFIQKRYL